MEQTTTILNQTTMPVLLRKGVSRRRWRHTLAKVRDERFDGDKAAFDEALRQTGLKDLNARPTWWVRNGVEDPRLSLTANTIRTRAAGLKLNETDAHELSLRWAFSRLTNPLRDYARFALPSRFARFATLASGEPVRVFANPSEQLVARVAHQLIYGWEEFHNIAISEHLFDCWVASRDQWLYLLHRGDHDYILGMLRDEKSITHYGDAIERAHAGLVNGNDTRCLCELDDIRHRGWNAASQEMYEDRELFDTINELFFASAYVSLMGNANDDAYFIGNAAHDIKSVNHRLNGYEGPVSFALPALLTHADAIANALKHELQQRIKRKKAERNSQPSSDTIYPVSVRTEIDEWTEALEILNIENL